MNVATISILALICSAQVPAEGERTPTQRVQDGTAAAGDNGSKLAAAAQRLALEELKQAAMRYRIVKEPGARTPLVLRTEPVLHWTNPVRHTATGAVFLWLADGRPEVVASFYRYTYEGKTVQDEEFQSLSVTGLTASRDGRDVWSPPKEGLSFAPIAGAPRPAATPAERLRQMRALAQEFRAFFDVPEDKSELRLLPKPLYRYETNRPDLLDGALFAFVLATDPEVLLVIEARPADGTPIWQYG